MTRYLVSFDDGAMTFPEEELPDVVKASHQVVEQAKAAGVWIFGGGVKGDESKVVATDGSVTDGPSPQSKRHLGGFAVVDVASHDEALKWAAKIAAACRCAQEVGSSCRSRPPDRGRLAGEGTVCPRPLGRTSDSQAQRHGLHAAGPLHANALRAT